MSKAGIHVVNQTPLLQTVPFQRPSNANSSCDNSSFSHRRAERPSFQYAGDVRAATEVRARKRAVPGLNRATHDTPKAALMQHHGLNLGPMDVK